MELFVVVIAILFVQIWGAENPLHQDSWLSTWITHIEKRFPKRADNWPWLVFFTVFIVAWLAFWLISLTSNWLLLPLSVVVLLYSFGRGEFRGIIDAYLTACKNDDWNSALENAAAIDVDVDAVDNGNWPLLHEHVLEQAAYRGFERMFAVLFWFFMLGPVVALMYRVVFLYTAMRPESAESARKLLWYMEWPAARVLGISFAVTGNFVGCYRRWRESLLCIKRPTQMTLAQSVLGALSVDDDITQTCEVTRKELTLLESLYQRTLWFWLAVVAVLIIIV